MISNAGESIRAEDIAIIEDQTQGKLIIRSRAPSAASVRMKSALSLSLPPGFIGSGSSRPASVDYSERAISAVASENIPDIVVESESDGESGDGVSLPPPRLETNSDSEDDVEIEIIGGAGSNLDVKDGQSRVPSVAELVEILEEKAATEGERVWWNDQ